MPYWYLSMEQKLMKKKHLDGITNFLWGCYVLFHCTFHQSNRHLSQNTIGSYIHKSGDKVPHSLLPYLHMFYPVVFFLPPWRWQMLACKGVIDTVAFNPRATTSSRGLRQSCLRLVWVHSSGGGSNSIVLNVVHIF